MQVQELSQQGLNSFLHFLRDFLETLFVWAWADPLQFFEDAIEVTAIAEPTCQKDFGEIRIWILEHLSRFLNAFFIDKVACRHAHFLFENFVEMAFAHAGLVA